MPKRVLRLAVKERYTITIFSLLFLALLFISNEDWLQKFTPRRMCMFGNEKLIALHLIADAVIGIAYIFLGADLYITYKALQTHKVPWKGYLWMAGGFIGLCGLTHLIGVLNLWVTYYWIDGIVKIATAIFSASVYVAFHKDSKQIRKMKDSEEYTRLADAYEKLVEQYQELKSIDKNFNS